MDQNFKYYHFIFKALHLMTAKTVQFTGTVAVKV